MSTNADFIGRGLSFPLGVDQSGALALTSGAADIAGSLRMVLMTAPGARLMRPQFGCRIWDLMFEPINANTIGMMSEAVKDAISQWEPRIDLEDVVIDVDDQDNGRVLINLKYRIRSTNDQRNLVYPFYVIPRETES